MENQSQTTWTWVAVVAVVVLLGIFALEKRNANAPQPLPQSLGTTTPGLSLATSSSSATSSSALSSSSDINVSLTGMDAGATVVPASQVPQPIPDLDRPVIGSSTDMTLTPGVLASIQAQVASLSASLKTQPGDEQGWIQLGAYRKEADDYDGAAQAWVYAAQLNPNDGLPLADLGDLYGFFLGEPEQGVANYKAAIVKNSSIESFYESLYELYYGVLHDVPDARATLVAGIQAKEQGYQNLESLLIALPQQ